MNGNLFFSLHESNAILRMPEADREDYGAEYPLRLFEPMAGRRMREYVVVPPELFATADIEPWIERAAANARTIPPKQPRGSRK
jgi:hypothetical protein